MRSERLDFDQWSEETRQHAQAFVERYLQAIDENEVENTLTALFTQASIEIADYDQIEKRVAGKASKELAVKTMLEGSKNVEPRDIASDSLAARDYVNQLMFNTLTARSIRKWLNTEFSF